MEAFLAEIGEFGKYQKKNFILLSLPTIVVAMQKFSWVFLGARVKHRCKLPWEDVGTEYQISEEMMDAYYPKNDRTGEPSMCLMYKISNTSLIEDNLSSNSSGLGITACTQYIYDYSEYDTSAVIDYELVCDRAWMRATVQSVFMVGMLIGSYIFGDLSDRIGRKSVFLSAIAMMLLFGIMQVSILNYWIFVFTRFILGASLQGIFLIAYVIIMEMVGQNKRAIVGIWAHSFYSIAYFTGAALAYCITSWRWLQVAFTLPAILFAPYYWIIPESARWLAAKGRYEQARALLEKAAEINKRKVGEDVLLAATTLPGGSKDGSFIDLFLYPSLRIKTIIVFFIWKVNSCVYYGLSLNTGNLGGNDYLNFLISGAVEFPALAFATMVIMRIGRRIPLCFFMLVAGVALYSAVIIPKEQNIWIIAMSMIGKMCITASYAVIYTFTAEIYPTVVRNVAVGSSSMIARVGGALSPYINLLGDYWTPLPLIIFGGLSLAAGLLGLLLPETKGEPMADFIKEKIKSEQHNFRYQNKDSEGAEAVTTETKTT